LEVGEVGVSAVTLAELEYGVGKSRRPEQNRIALYAFCAPLEVRPFHDACAAAYGRVRADLEREEGTIGPMDLLIAAHALAEGATLVTSNEREFCRVQGLEVENWL
jgi:tRNA(fMet)-specific endonuclease VapC